MTWNDPYPTAGSYVVVETGGFPSWVIRKATRSWANHAFIVADDEGGVIEAQPGGVARGNIEKYAGCRMAWNAIDLTTNERNAQVVVKAESLVGVAYNDVDIFNLGLESLDIRWKWLAKIAAGDEQLICSQLVAVCGQAGGFNWLCGKSGPAEVTPGDLAARSVMRALVL